MIDKKRILIIDGNNLYLRNYSINPTVSRDGKPIGGIIGFIKSLQKLCKFINPNRIVVCWDGKNGTSKRKEIFNNYKDGRMAIRFNKNINLNDDNEQLKNKIWQMTRIVEYLNNMPIIQILFDDVEADDLISAVVNHKSLLKYNKIIVSNDKDFIQLCNENTILYRPVKEEILNSKRILDLYGINVINFCLARSICGDKSDNLDGVGGVGLPTLSKRLPILKEDVNLSIEDIKIYCENANQDIKIFKNILNNLHTIERNYKIMQLKTPNINSYEYEQIEYSLENSECIFNKNEITKMMLSDGFIEIKLEDLFSYMHKIVLENC